MASKDGKKFESAIQNSAKYYNIYCERIKDSASSFGQDSGFTKYTVKNPYDFFFFYNRAFFPSELKSTEMTSISIQREKKAKGKMIKLNQIEGLSKGIKHEYIFPHFLLDFRVTGNTYYLRIEDFLRFLNDSEKKSINEKDVIEYGGFIVDKTLLRSNYRYYLSKVFDLQIKNYEGEK